VKRRAHSIARACALFLLLFTSLSRAELGDDVTRLSKVWREHGVVRHLPPRLGERSAPSVIFLPVELLAGASSSCISVAVLGPSSIHFTLRAVGGAYVPESVEDWPQASLAGLVQITRCGARKARLGALLVEMRSPRAVLEVVAVESREPVPPATDVLLQRDPGPIAPLMGFGPPGAPPPIAERLTSAELHAQQEGDLELQRDSVQSTPRGTGSVHRVVEPGCHRWQVLAEPGGDANRVSDLAVIPELSAAAGLVAVDRGDGYAATIGFCAGERTTIGFRFAGASSSARVWLVASRTPLPDGLPDGWGSGGRARMAAVLRRYEAKVSGMPLDQALGVQGPTLMPIAVEPGACYVAALTAVQGQAFSLALGASTGAIRAQNHTGLSADGTLISFCSRSESLATIEADSRGTGLTWLFALWQTGRVAVGEEVPR
jgi:hypothetical protein